MIIYTTVFPVFTLAILWFL